jgi:NAD(P)-dependent dehydrogenase (short-subunit alcohol dehydrogenase family)
MQDISGKTAIITGAASGIGLGIATALAEAGANVVMADIQKDALEQAAHGLSGTNKRVMPVRIDVTTEQSVLDALAEAERHFGKLHIACNNAGVPMHGVGLVDAGGLAICRSQHLGDLHGIRHLVPAILKHGEEGHVVNTRRVPPRGHRPKPPQARHADPGARADRSELRRGVAHRRGRDRRSAPPRLLQTRLLQRYRPLTNLGDGLSNQPS